MIIIIYYNIERDRIEARLCTHHMESDFLLIRFRGHFYTGPQTRSPSDLAGPVLAVWTTRLHQIRSEHSGHWRELKIFDLLFGRSGLQWEGPSTWWWLFIAVCECAFSQEQLMVVKVVAQINTNWISLSFGQLSVAPKGPSHYCASRYWGRDKRQRPLLGNAALGLVHDSWPECFSFKKPLGSTRLNGEYLNMQPSDGNSSSNQSSEQRRTKEHFPLISGI